MKRISQLVLVSLAGIVNALAGPVSFMVTELESGKILVQEGEVDKRVTPCSTFKIPLSLMGYDAGYLTDAMHPIWKFEEEYKSWNNSFYDSWAYDQDPATWMKYSCVWFSQKLTKTLGMKHFKSYVRVFDYGNMDLTGNGDLGDGLTYCWLGSSLKISPIEQVTFIEKMLKEELGLIANAYEMTKAILFNGDLPNGWKLYGKTGSCSQRNPDGSLINEHQIGWFVGWVQKNNQTLVFAHLIEDDNKESTPAGWRSRDLAKAKLLPLVENLP